MKFRDRHGCFTVIDNINKGSIEVRVKAFEDLFKNILMIHMFGKVRELIGTKANGVHVFVNGFGGFSDGGVMVFYLFDVTTRRVGIGLR